MDRVTRMARCFQSGALRVRFPRPAGDGPPEAVMINTAGGLTGGDALHIDVKAGPGAQAIFYSQACEKIYKSSGEDIRINTTLTLDQGAALEWLPQPSILFDHSQLKRFTRVDLAEDSSFLGLEAYILGRTAMGEGYSAGKLNDHWQIRRNGRLIFADSVRIDGEGLSRLAMPWALDKARAFAFLIWVAPNAEQNVDRMRKILQDSRGEGAVSAWNSMLACRMMARDGYSLIRDLVQVLTQFRGRPLARIWSI